ncbi:MAG TPA: hypothetical protein VHC71_08005 [Hyphomicrobium sp.]|nr:hypothetical protein [Hyphomicrobium sp.]
MSNNRTHSAKPTFGRRTSLAQALLQIGGDASLRCTVHQIDDEGAEIELSRPVVLPMRVRLYWEQLGDGADCDVARTEGAIVRVVFTSSKGSEILRRFEADRASQRQRADI